MLNASQLEKLRCEPHTKLASDLVPLSSRENYLNSDLRRLTTLIAVAITFFGLILLAIIVYAGWTANETATERERTLVANALNQAIARALNEQKSVAWWDDPITKITDQHIDLEFTDANFGVFLTETYGHDEVYILNAKDQPLYSWSNHERKDPADFERRRAVLEPLIAEIRHDDHSKLRPRPNMFAASRERYNVLIGVRVARWAGHIVTVDGQPAIVAGMTIVPNIDMSLLKGTPNLLLSITYIDKQFIGNIGRSLLLTNLELTKEPVNKSAMVSEPFVTDDGTKAGYLTWTTRQPGQVLLTIILPLVACGVLFMGLLSKILFGRLRRASTALAQREFEARHQAMHDALSGLPNRANMVQKIDKFLSSYIARHNGQRALAAYIDIDRFKDVNDTLGHEFVILCAPAGPEAGPTLVERIRQSFESPFAIKGQSIRETASVGLAVAPDNGATADELMRHADIALYEAKSQGRDRAVYFTTEMAEDVEHRRSIELDLRYALENEELDLHYQPIISASTGGAIGVEALLRWQHPLYGSMPPAEFIPIAENAGLLPAIGEWVLNRAMTDSKQWPNLQVAVNLSPVQFRHVDLVTMLRQLIVTHAIDPSLFVLEITEGVLLELSDRVSTVLAAIHDMGFKTALDDFGTGYSSLSYLCNFQFDKIKIDRSFISNISRVDSTKTIVKSVVTLGRALGMEIVAEGIETEFEAAMMIRFGCTELQGFYFSKPLRVEQTVEFLKTYEPKQPHAETKSTQWPAAG